MTDESAPRHPVRVVVQRTGLTPDVLRAWQRRYQVIEPTRTAGGQRLYSNADIERLGLLHEATRSGRAIGQLAPLDNAALRELIAADRSAASSPAAISPDIAERHLEVAYAAIAALHPDELELALRQAVLALGAMPMLTGVLTPLLKRVGEAWHQGRLSVAHEHAASAVVRRLLDWMAAAYNPGPDAPTLGLATLEGERHEFGAMVAMAAALPNGWNALYFGPDLPAQDIAAAVEKRQLRAVGLSVIYVDDPDRVAGAIEELRRAIPASIPLVIGGSGVRRVRDRLQRLDVLVADDLDSFVAALRPLTEARR